MEGKWVSVWGHKNIEEEQRHEKPRAPVLPQGAKSQAGVEDEAGDRWPSLALWLWGSCRE